MVILPQPIRLQNYQGGHFRGNEQKSIFSENFSSNSIQTIHLTSWPQKKKIYHPPHSITEPESNFPGKKMFRRKSFEEEIPRILKTRFSSRLIGISQEPLSTSPSVLK